jgi:mono/diheme cytochrome c family protein
MILQWVSLEEGRVPRHLAPIIGLLAAMVSTLVVVSAQAQTNIDQGKTPAQIFAGDCAACHKSARGLANGKNSLSLTSFLREHYTASREQASSLAAYVLGAGGGDTGPEAKGHSQKPAPERAKLQGEEPKTAARPTKPTGKPEVEAPAMAKPQRPEEDAKPKDEPSIMTEPSPAILGRRPGAARREGEPATASRGRKKELEAAPQEREAAPAVVPALTETPKPAEIPVPATSAAAPEMQPGDEAPVPRDNIPD